MRKGIDHFKKAIEAELTKRTEQDPLFAENYTKPEKNLEDCCKYIIGQVKKSGAVGLPDDIVFGLAMHYYDEDDIDENELSSLTPMIVVNREVRLTEEEKAEIREKAKQELLEAEKQRLRTGSKSAKRSAPSESKKESQLTLLLS